MRNETKEEELVRMIGGLRNTLEYAKNKTDCFESLKSGGRCLHCDVAMSLRDANYILSKMIWKD